MRRDSRRNYAVGIQHIREALIACGYAKLDQQEGAFEAAPNDTAYCSAYVCLRHAARKFPR